MTEEENSGDCGCPSRYLLNGIYMGKYCMKGKEGKISAVSIDFDKCMERATKSALYEELKK